MHRFRLLRSLLLFLLLIGCEEIIEYHPNEIRLDEDETNLTYKNLERLKANQPGDTVRVILMGDTQRFYDHIEDFYKSASQQSNIDLMLHCGDISDFGLAQEFKWVHSILKQLPFPYLTVVGNHDLLANGKKVYEHMYGPIDYHFDYGGIRFVMLNTNSREYGYDGTVPDIGWLQKALITPSSVHQAVVVSHMPPFDGGFDKKLEIPYIKALQQSRKVKTSLHGHQHRSYTSTPYEDGTKYIVTSSMKGRSYYVIKFWKGGFHAREVKY